MRLRQSCSRRACTSDTAACTHCAAPRCASTAAEVHALIGENGSGKSTMLRILSGQIQPDAGSIQFAGRPTSFRGSDGCAAPGHRDGHAGDDARTRPLGRREHLPRASHGAARRPHRLEDDARAGARGDRAARARPRPVAPGPPAAARPAADGRDRACPLDRRARADPRRAHELAHRRRGRVALRGGPQASGRRRRRRSSSRTGSTRSSSSPIASPCCGTAGASARPRRRS